MKKKIFLLFLVLFSLAYLPGVYGVGIQSENLERKVNFEPNLAVEYSYIIKATTTQPHKIEFDGDLAQYFTAVPNSFEMINEGEKKPFTVKMALPPSIETPGIHKTRVCASESKSSGGEVGSMTRSCGVIYVLVFFDGKKLVGTLGVKDINVGDEAVFGLGLENWGKQGIDKVKAKINVYDSSGQVVATVTGPETSIPAKGKITQEVIWATSSATLPGQYKALAEIDGDGNKITSEKIFLVGSKNVELAGYTQSLKKGGIQRFEATLKNAWGLPLSNVYFILKVKDQEVKSPSLDLKPWEEGITAAFIDTSSLAEGGNTGKVKIFYEGETKEVDVTFKVGSEEASGKIKEEAKSSSGKQVYWVIGVILTLAILTVIFYLVKKRAGTVASSEGKGGF